MHDFGDTNTPDRVAPVARRPAACKWLQLIKFNQCHYDCVVRTGTICRLIHAHIYSYKQTATLSMKPYIGKQFINTEHFIIVPDIHVILPELSTSFTIIIIKSKQKTIKPIICVLWCCYVINVDINLITFYCQHLFPILRQLKI